MAAHLCAQTCGLPFASFNGPAKGRENSIFLCGSPASHSSSERVSIASGNCQLSSKKVVSFEEKSTLRSFQGVMCTCSSIDYSYFSKSSAVEQLRAVEVRASGPDTQEPSAPPQSSLLCKQCEGNGALLCSQCKGGGINKEDFFNGHFKAGTICWLCRGKREILCGDCNGAGFVGGFMSTFDE